MTDLRELAEDIHDEVSGETDHSVDDLEARLENLHGEYDVPKDEAKRSLISSIASQNDLDRETLMGESSAIDVAEITEEGNWVDLTVKVVELWDSDADSVGQTGLIGDETGRTKFTKWAKSDLPEMEEGRVYELSDVVTDGYEGRMSVNLNSQTTITEVDADIEVGDEAVEYEGALVDVQSGSGLIKRCPDEDCTRVLQNGRCSEHGDLEEDGVFDTRLKAVFDSGNSTQEAIFDEEMTEEITGISLEEAQEIAMDTLDTESVIEEMKPKIIGRYYRIKGPNLGRYLLVNEFDQLDTTPDVSDALIKARSM